MLQWFLNLLAQLFQHPAGAATLAGLPPSAPVPDSTVASPQARPVPVLLDELLAAGVSRANAQIYLAYLNQACALFDIVTPLRVAHFLATVVWESEYMRRVREVGTLDGTTWPGIGLIQLTGEKNQLACAAYFRIAPERTAIQTWLATPLGAALSAAWFWGTNNLNALADRDDVVGIRRRVNGPGMNGLVQVEGILRQLKTEMELS